MSQQECKELFRPNPELTGAGSVKITDRMETLLFVTTNQGKAKEVMAMLPSVDMQIASINLPELQGDINSIAMEKARTAANMLQCSVLVEDTALVFSAFGDGLPGPYIKDFLGHIGLGRIPRLLDSFDDKRATAICTFSICAWPGLEVKLFQGRTTVGDSYVYCHREQ